MKIIKKFRIPVIQNCEMVIGNDGSLRMIYDDDVAKVFGEIARITVRRASHVEPEEYRALSWPPGVTRILWRVDMGPVDGPMLGPFPTREAALNAEHAWLIEHDIPFPKEG